MLAEAALGPAADAATGVASGMIETRNRGAETAPGGGLDDVAFP